MEKGTLRRADLVFSIVLLISSALYMFECLKIFINPFNRLWEKVPAEGLKETFTFWYKSPSLIPFMMAFCLFLCGLALMHTAFKDGAKIDFLSRDKITAFLKNRELHAFLICVIMLCVYAFFLIPVSRRYLNVIRGFRVFPFFVATFLYLVSMMVLFGQKQPKQIIKSALISVCASGLVTWSFGILAQIPLP